VSRWYRVIAGVRPEKPDKCPDTIFKLMEQCWQQDPAERPTFASLKMDIQDAYAAEVAPQAAQQEDEENLCVVCMENQAECALIPCGHKCVCEEDATAMCRLGVCPICRCVIQSHMKIFGD
jgi:hypothetical protein